MQGDPNSTAAGQPAVSAKARLEARQRRARLLLWASAAIVAATGIYVAVTSVRLVIVYQDVQQARAALLALEAGLLDQGLQTSDGELQEAEAQALAAGARFRSAEGFLEGEPLLRLARQMPWLGSQVEAAAELAAIGHEGSDIGLAGIEALRSFNALAAEAEGTLGQRVTVFLDAVRPQIALVEERLASIREHRGALDSGLLPPLARLAVEVDERLSYLDGWVTKYRADDALAPELLGYEGARTYLILGQDNTELMPGGGLIGVYGLITLDQGTLTESVFADVGDLIQNWQTASGGEYIEPPGPLKRYLLRDWTWNLAVSNWSPDFPTAARQALTFYDLGGGPPVDGVIAIDFTTLEGLLSVLGPVTIAEYGVTLSAANVTEETLIRTRTVLRPNENKHAFAMATAWQVVDEALAAGNDEWAPLLETLDWLADGKHIAVYAREPDVQAALRELGWSGEVREPPGDYLQIVEASVHSTKLNLVVEQEAEVQIRLDATGNAHHRVTIHYENQFTRWAEGRDPDLTYDLMLSGFYGDYVRLLAPPQARLTELTLDGRGVGAEEIIQEAGKASFGRYLPLPKGAEASLSFSYVVPAVVTFSNGVYEYRLLVQKQAGTRAMPLEISISLPEGASLQRVVLDGKRLPDDPLSIETKLDRDRDLIVRYRQ